MVTVRQGDLPKEKRWPLKFLRGVVEKALLQGKCLGPSELGLTLTTDAEIRRLNATYRGLDKATDVLAFALEEGPPMALPEGMPRQLGDVIVSLETVERQAGEFGNSLESELAWVICHGTLHLLGFDHQDEAQLGLMREQERQVFEQLGLQRCWGDLSE